MKTNVLLPQVELTMESAIIAKWLVKVGDQVRAEQPIVEVETQKATSEVVAPVAGYVRKLCVNERDNVPEKALLCILTDTPDEPFDDTGTPSAPVGAGLRPARSPTSDEDRAGLRPAPTEDGGAVRATPLARKLAKELGIDLLNVRGTGPGGRITDEDVRAASSSASGSSRSAAAGEGWTPFPPTRLALIAQMQKSLAEIPQIHLMRQLDVTAISAKVEGITFTHRLVRAAAAALAKHPALRSITDGQRLRAEPVSVAIAMDTPHGLVAPAVRQADKLDLSAISAKVKELRTQADANTLRREDLVNAPFAITNLGMLGIDSFDAFVFHGQTAVLSIGRTTDAPNNRKLAWFGLAVDHRIVDGAEGARFLETLQAEVSRP